MDTSWIRLKPGPLSQQSILNSILISLISAAVGIVVAFLSSNFIHEAKPTTRNRMTMILNMMSNFSGVPLAFAFMILMGNSGVLTNLGQQAADTPLAQGCIVTYNHPIWSRVRLEEFEHGKGITALEVYNCGTVDESGTGYDVTFWDQILREGRQLYGFASDDNHNEGVFDDACGGWICVQADHLDHDGVITAIRQGAYYSSSGPQIFSFSLRDDTIYLECSPCERINFICGGYINAGMTIHPAPGGLLTRVSFPLRGTEQYVRAECIDRGGKRALTNALFFTRAGGEAPL